MHPAGRRSAGTRAGRRAQGKGAAPSDPRRRRRRRLRSAGRRRRAAGARAGSCAAFWRSIYNAAAPVQSRRPGSRRVLASTALAAEGHHVISRVGADAAPAPARWHTRALHRGRLGAARPSPGRDGAAEPPRGRPGTSERAAGVPARNGRSVGLPARRLPPGPCAPARAAGERSDLGPRRRTPQRLVLLLLLLGRRALSRKRLRLHLPPLCLNAALDRDPGEGAPRLAPPGAPGNLRRGPHGLAARGRDQSGVRCPRRPQPSGSRRSDAGSQAPARGRGARTTPPGSAPALRGPRMRPAISVQVQGGRSARAPGPREAPAPTPRAGGEGAKWKGKGGSPRPAPSA